MAKAFIVAASAGLLSLAACSAEAPSVGEMAGGAELANDAAEARADAPFADTVAMESAAGDTEAAANTKEASTASPSAIPSSTPQIAYRYEYGFRLPSKAIAPLQEQHADMCQAKGPDICRIISMSKADAQGDYTFGNLHIAVAAKQARDFGKQLTRMAEGADGEQTSSAISGEDLSKQIIDTEARLRARTVLRDRLMEVLRNRKGTVAELVEAERGVAQVNEEIDQATSWLSEMRGRVAFSQMHIQYSSGSPNSGGFLDPIRQALGSVGSIIGTVISVIIVALAWGLPLALFGGLLLWAWRKLGGKEIWRRNRQTDHNSADSDANA